MDELKDKAAYYRIGLETGVFTITEVIKWADSEITKSESPDELLIDISLMEDANPHDVLSKLKELSISANNLNALRKILSKMYPILKSKPHYSPSFARRLYQIFIEFNYNIPDDLNHIGMFDDEYSLALQGIYDTERNESDRFLEFLKPFYKKK